MSLKNKKASAGLLEDKKESRHEDDGKSESISKDKKAEKKHSGSADTNKGAAKGQVKRRQTTKRFAKDRANTVGKEQGARYLTLAICGLFLPPLAPVAWLLSQSLRSFARTHEFLLDNRTYAAWVIGLVSTIFYGFLLLVIALQYILISGYSLL